MTTNFENSKKLAEIGFVGESETWKHDPDNFITGQKYWSYDLETLLKALPTVINGMPLKMRLDRSTHIGYNSSYEAEEQFVCFQYKNESLADTAARLLITLVEQKIINFK